MSQRRSSILSIVLGTAITLSACGGGGGGGSGSVTGLLEETAQMAESASSEWWLNSGGLFDDEGNGGSTVQGDISSGSRWKAAYAASSPTDTDGGEHPQNLFRLIRRQILRNPHEEMTFEIHGLNLSKSSNRNESNGVLLFSHYLDGDNLYYAGVRVDGNAVIKKKRRGIYATLAITKIYPGAYRRNGNPNLIPVNQPIALASDTIVNGDGSVTVRLSVGGRVVLEAVDRGALNGPALRDPGYVGIRTDFMDIAFQGFEAEEVR